MKTFLKLSYCFDRDAGKWTPSDCAVFVTLQGRCVFASGSPFPAVTYNGKTFHPGQGNNAYIFPGIALATILCDIRSITDEVFLESAKVWTYFR